MIKNSFFFPLILTAFSLPLTAAATGDEVGDIIGEQANDETPKVINKPQAVFQALNKISGRSIRVEATVGEVATFEDLEIRIKACQERTPEFVPESAVFAQVKEVSTQNQAFSGWMFASAPSLSPFEHPLFDLYLIGCKELYEKADLKSDETDLTKIKPAPPRPANLGALSSAAPNNSAPNNAGQSAVEDILNIQ